MGKSFRPEIRMTSPRMMIPAAGIQIIRTSGTSMQTISPMHAPESVSRLQALSNLIFRSGWLAKRIAESAERQDRAPARK